MSLTSQITSSITTIITTFLVVLSQASAFGQIGIFKSFEDFQNNKVDKYHEYIKTSNALGNFKIVFLDRDGNKEKIDISKTDMWGYRRDDGAIVRINEKNNPNVIIANGSIVVYGNFSTTISNNLVTIKSTNYVPQISKGLNDTMVNLTKRNLRKLISNDQAALEKLKETSAHYQDLIDFIQEYNKSQSISPGNSLNYVSKTSVGK